MHVAAMKIYLIMLMISKKLNCCIVW